ncbi:MAG: polyisoprenoid-binding protein [Xanthomonadales bacterium]|nr:polyisoprenoid-binding protein [Xanthomonadales bacterium]
MAIRSPSLLPLVCLATLAWLPPAFATPAVYRLDPVHTQVLFQVDHQGFSAPFGRVRLKQGWFRFDPDDWSQGAVDVELDLASVDMGDAKWNETIRSGQLLDTERWPTARFRSRSVAQDDARHGLIHGELTLHGRTRPLDIAVTLNRIAVDPYMFRYKAGFSATASVPRMAFGIDRYAEVIGREIKVFIEIEGLRDRNASGEDAGDTPP